MQARDHPLEIAVALKRALYVDFVLLHITGELEFRHVHLPGAAVQATAGFDQTIQF